MPKTHTFKTGRVLVGDCLDRLRDLPDASIDAVVTDPPYLIDFMGKGWDAEDGVAGKPEVWAECLRVLKPGGYLLAFGATRTYHRMTVAIEDAGFEIRDSLHWSYGVGFPKSLDVSKAIDKKANAKRKVIGKRKQRANGTASLVPMNASAGDVELITAPATPDAEKWSGWGTALKPSHEPIVMARKPLIGTVADNVLEHGTGALNIAASRVGSEEVKRTTSNGEVLSDNTSMAGPNYVRIEAGTATGRWPANTILTHHADCQQVGSKAETMTGGFGNGGVGMGEIGQDGDAGKGAEWQDKETSTPVYECAEGCPVPVLDEQSGYSQSPPVGSVALVKSSKERGHAASSMEFSANGAEIPNGYGDKGGASRFFKQTEWDEELDPFIYIPKPSKREKNEGLDDLEPKLTPVGDRQARDAVGGDNPRNRSNTPNKNNHPTVKPVALMRYLIKLVTPPGGVVLDPFLGSGTTAVAAIMEGHEWVGVEYTPEYLPIIKGRVQHAQEKAEAEKPQPEQLDLLDAGA